MSTLDAIGLRVPGEDGALCLPCATRGYAPPGAAPIPASDALGTRLLCRSCGLSLGAAIRQKLLRAERPRCAS